MGRAGESLGEASMLSGLEIIRVRINKGNSKYIDMGIFLSLNQFYSLYGDKEVEIYHKGDFVTGSFKEHFIPSIELYRINIGSSSVDITGDSLIQTSRGIKKVKDLRTTDLIACYEEDSNFSENNIAYKSIYSVTPVKCESNYPVYSCNQDFTLFNNMIILGAN